eukprot:CAMPEP_0173374750 /NCGR_PEP_ID=MMETSP1144-20121109/29247_1 /TAXON_ID=483371 /ORGANISM="non described non described, Strain CCMP2298" /LENGTH=91 /DNA_ID=CAMNT_0014327111 /DNA_START=299 /DNA_END=574 /DNA_ORIENTATION=-
MSCSSFMPTFISAFAPSIWSKNAKTPVVLRNHIWPESAPQSLEFYLEFLSGEGFPSGFCAPLAGFWEWVFEDEHIRIENEDLFHIVQGVSC